MRFFTEAILSTFRYGRDLEAKRVRSEIMSAIGNWLNFHRGQTVMFNYRKVFTAEELETMDAFLEEIIARRKLNDSK
jgi:hypothetical protein